MKTNDYKEDLEYLYSVLLNHPSIILGEKKKAEFEALYLAICEVVYDYDSFIDGATKLTTFFQDGHTNIEIPYTSQDLCLNLKCCWSRANDNELILEDEYEDIPKHARIMGVEEMSIEDLIVALADKIPHENIYLVKSRMIMYPYQNYHLFSELNLKRLFGCKKYYLVSFLVDGEMLKKKFHSLSMMVFWNLYRTMSFLHMKFLVRQ